jgi:hypothetical protein
MGRKEETEGSVLKLDVEVKMSLCPTDSLEDNKGCFLLLG